VYKQRKLKGSKKIAMSLNDESTPTDMSLDDKNCALIVPDISFTVTKRPRYAVCIGDVTFYCQNVEGCEALLASHGRTISTGDVFKALDIPPRSRYRLLERLNGATIQKIARL
jgi:4-diphosphocytidyl-2C-methyl-D-erythritol kinase